MDKLKKAAKIRRTLAPVSIFLLLSMIEFLLFYVFLLFFSSYSGYYVYFAQRLALLTLFVASAVTVYHTADNAGEVILHSFLISTTRCIFFLPFFYLEFLSNALYDSIDAIALSIFASIGVTVIHAAGVIGLCCIIKGVCKKRGLAKGELSSPIDFKSPFSAAVIIISLVIALINFAVELVTAIIFIIQSSGILFISEVIYIAFSLLFPIVILLAMYFLSILIAKWISKIAARWIKRTERKAELKEASETQN